MGVPRISSTPSRVREGKVPLIVSTSGYMSKKRVRTLAAKRGWKTRRRRYGRTGSR